MFMSSCQMLIATLVSQNQAFPVALYIDNFKQLVPSLWSCIVAEW